MAEAGAAPGVGGVDVVAVSGAAVSAVPADDEPDDAGALYPPVAGAGAGGGGSTHSNTCSGSPSE